MTAPLVIENIQLGSLGTIHTLLAFTAILAGGLVVAWRKGTRFHKLVGRVYFVSMAGLNLSALLIYSLFGVFGPFHWLALASLLTIAAGLVPAVRKKPIGSWLFYHAEFMSWSYVGLLAAAVSEVTTRLLHFPFGWTVAITSLLVLVTGGIVLKRAVPGAVARVRERRGVQADE